MRVDVEGEYWQLIAIGAAVGGTVSGVISAYYSYKDHGYFEGKVFLTNFATGAVMGALSMTSMKRAFLFDKECVSDEILAHLKGYLWCVGKIKSFPLRFYGYYYIDSEKKERTINNIVYRVKESCKQADIKESDVYLNKAEASSMVGFDYFNHIQKCYIKTKSDPYYNIKTKQRDKIYERKAWLYEKLKEK